MKTRWLAILLLVALTSCSTDASPPGRSQTQAISTPTPTVPTRLGTDAENYRAAALEADRVMHLAPLPPAAVHLTGQPADWPDAGFGMSPADRSLTRTAWYRVALGADAVQKFLLSHVPAGMTAGDGIGSSVGTRTFSYAEANPPDPAAYTAPQLLLLWSDTGPSTVIRYDVMLASRRARTPASYLTSPVTSIDIERTARSTGGRGRDQLLPTIAVEARKDPGKVARLTAIFNGLYGATTPVSQLITSCPAGFPAPTYTLVFHTTGGTLTYRMVNGCYSEIDVSRRGRPVNPPLDPGNVRQELNDLLGYSSIRKP